MCNSKCLLLHRQLPAQQVGNQDVYSLSKTTLDNGLSNHCWVATAFAVELANSSSVRKGLLIDQLKPELIQFLKLRKATNLLALLTFNPFHLFYFSEAFIKIIALSLASPNIKYFFHGYFLSFLIRIISSI